MPVRKSSNAAALATDQHVGASVLSSTSKLVGLAGDRNSLMPATRNTSCGMNLRIE